MKKDKTENQKPDRLTKTDFKYHKKTPKEKKKKKKIKNSEEKTQLDRIFMISLFV